MYRIPPISTYIPYTTLFRSQDSERREAPLHPFIASAEETDLASGARLSARVSELSLKGCYLDRKSTRLNSSHPSISYAVFCLKKKNKRTIYHIYHINLACNY